jgi:hypothetical protein
MEKIERTKQNVKNNLLLISFKDGNNGGARE